MAPLPDWDRVQLNIRLTEALRDFPRILIAQVHGYCLGASFALMNVHDLVFAADNAQIGMPEMPRGSFGEIATSTLFHAQIPIKKASLIALTARNMSGIEAERIGLVNFVVPDGELMGRVLLQLRRYQPLERVNWRLPCDTLRTRVKGKSILEGEGIFERAHRRKSFNDRTH